MFNKLFSLILSISSLLFITPAVLAADRPHFVSFVNPVRGEEGWLAQKQTPLDLPTLQYHEATKSAYPVTWLLRYDAVNSATISAFFKEVATTGPNQNLGAFLEITPNLTSAAGVAYPEGETFTAPNRIFLSGYSQTDRIKLIDRYMDLFYNVYNYYPKTVGAWHLDAYSLNYLSSHYSVVGAVVCDEQYTTDNYRFWGSYLGSPYFPSKLNSLVPASGRDNRIPIAVTKWVGNLWEVPLSYSNSNNDFNEFTQISVGLENDYDVNMYRKEIKKTYMHSVFISLADFGTWLANRYTFTNPAFFYKTSDITGNKDGFAYWYQNPFYRIGLRSANGDTQIIDFRLYNQNEAEETYLTKNTNRILHVETNPLVDSVKYPGQSLHLPIDLTKAVISYDHWKVIFKEAGKEFRLEPERLVFNQLEAPDLNSREIKVSTKIEQTIWKVSPKLPYEMPPLVAVAIFGTAITVVSLLLLWTKDNKTRFILIIGWLIGSFSLVTVFRSGLVYPFGLGFWGPNGHDAIFHLSLSESFKSNPFSLVNPQLSGTVLKNYHFGFDWLAGLISRLTGISTMDIYFRLFPALVIIAIIFVIVPLLISWRFSPTAIIFSIIMAFMAGSAGFLPSVFSGRGLFGGESFFWANQSVSLLLNPPFALSLLLILIFLLALEKHPHRLNRKQLLALSILGGVLVQIKVYAFILLFLSLVINKKAKLALGVGLFGLLFITPSLGGNQSFPFLVRPLWFARSTFESVDRLYWPRLAQAWQVYEYNGVLPKLILVNFLAVIVFYVGNLWTRLFGLWSLIYPTDLSLSGKLTKSIILAGLFLPLVFIQQVNPWNTIQFMYYSLFFLGLFTAREVDHWFSKKHLFVFKLICFGVITLISLPTTIGTLSDYLTNQSASRISLTELRALDMLRQSSPGTVVSPLTYTRYIFPVPEPKPLYTYASTAYISALTGHPEYLSDTINLDITGFEYSDRIKNVLRFYQTRDPIWAKKFLVENSVKYVYETYLDRIMVRAEDICLNKIFDSGEINLYKYSCP